MRIQITKITQQPNREICVNFHSEFGTGRAVWGASLPSTDHEYDVEIDLDDLFVWHENFSAADETIKPQFSLEQGAMKLVAEVVSLEQDGCLAVKIGNSIVLLETQDLPLGYSNKIQCLSNKVKLFPVQN